MDAPKTGRFIDKKENYTLNKPNDNVHAFLTHYAALWLHYSIFLRVVAKHLKNRHHWI